MKEVSYEIQENELRVGLDKNEDGEKSLKLDVKLNEALQEAFKKGKKVEGAKVVDFSFKGTTLHLLVDTDQDGEELLELTLNLPEALEESGIL